MSSHLFLTLKTFLAFCMIALIAGCSGGTTQEASQAITDQAAGAIVAKIDGENLSKFAVKAASSISGNAGKITRLYQAAFNRGAGHSWIELLDSGGG